MKYYKEIVYNGCTSEKGFSHDYFGFNGYCATIRTNVFNEDVKYNGFGGNKKGSLKSKCKLCWQVGNG